MPLYYLTHFAMPALLSIFLTCLFLFSLSNSPLHYSDFQVAHSNSILFSPILLISLAFRQTERQSGKFSVRLSTFPISRRPSTWELGDMQPSTTYLLDYKKRSFKIWYSFLNWCDLGLKWGTLALKSDALSSELMRHCWKCEVYWCNYWFESHK